MVSLISSLFIINCCAILMLAWCLLPLLLLFTCAPQQILSFRAAGALAWRLRKSRVQRLEPLGTPPRTDSRNHGAGMLQSYIFCKTNAQRQACITRHALLGYFRNVRYLILMFKWSLNSLGFSFSSSIRWVAAVVHLCRRAACLATR